MVFSPKYHGKILVGDVALALEGITRKTCKDPDLDIAMNVDQVHLLRGCVALWTCYIITLLSIAYMINTHG